jgi:transposase
VAVNVRCGDVDQMLLMPPSVRDWIPEDHLAFFLLDVVAELDLAGFYAVYRADGRGGSVYDPTMMLSVLLYAYCTGERSSRRIERRLVEDVAYRVVATNLQPDHATLARFRRRHQDAIAELFGQVLGLCVKAGLVDAGLIAIDGTKIAANASFFANRDQNALSAELAGKGKVNSDAASDAAGDAAREVARGILDEAEAVDAAEDEEHGEGRGGGLPPPWSGGRGRRERIRAALDELESQKAGDYRTRMAEREKKEAERGRKLTGPKPSQDLARRPGSRRANTTDPHSRIIANASKGVVQGYNAQAAATAENIVVAAEVTTTSNDQPHFVPLATAATKNLTDAGHRDGVGTFLADAGYWTAANSTADVGAEVLIATRKTAWRKADKPDDDKLAVLARVNRGELSQRKAGEILGVSYTWVRDMTKRYFGTEGQRISRHAEPEPEEWIPVIERVARGELSKRAASDQLTVSDARVNAMLAHVRGEATDPAIARKAMNEKFADPTKAKIYKRRASTIEPVFGNIKGNLGYRRFALRSLPAVNSEWRLMCTVHNLLKLRQAALA